MSRGKPKFIYKYRKVEYEVVGEDDDMSLRLVNDFKYCARVGDYLTIENRIANGLKWGWLRHVTNN